MAVAETDVVRVIYALDTGGDDGLEFTIPFPFLDSSEIHAIGETAGGVQTVLSGYTVTGGNNSPGELTFSGELSNDYASLTIFRLTALSQLLDLNYNEGVSLALLEDAFDKITRALQDIKHGREVMRFPITEDASAFSDLPPAAMRANKLAYFNTSGELELLSLADLQTALDAL